MKGKLARAWNYLPEFFRVASACKCDSCIRLKSTGCQCTILKMKDKIYPMLISKNNVMYHIFLKIEISEPIK